MNYFSNSPQRRTLIATMHEQTFPLVLSEVKKSETLVGEVDSVTEVKSFVD